MEASHRKSDFLQRGVSGIAVVLIVAGFFVVSVGFLSWKFKPNSIPNSSGNFFERTSALVSKTFGDMFLSGRSAPVVEINLGEQATNVNGKEIKNPTVAANEPLKVEPSGEKKSAGKISGSKNSNSPAEHLTVQSNTSGNIFSVSSSSGSELPAADNSKISKSSSPAPCDVIKVQTSNHKILFSEVAWMGSTKSASDEWIELKNNSGQNVPLRGWQILSDDENIKIVFEEKNNLLAGTFYLLERSDDNSAPNVSADNMYTGALSNDGARLRIFNANCELVDDVNASGGWPAGDNVAKKTMERSSLDLSWHTSANAGGTPKAQNSAAFSKGQESIGSQSGSASAADSASQNAATSSNAANNAANATSTVSLSDLVLVSEIMAGTDVNAYDEFVELYNPGNQGIDLTGWSLKKRSSTGSESTLLAASHLNGIILQSHRHFLIVNASATLAVSPDISWPKSYTLAYTQNAVVLYNRSGAKIDEANWDDIPKNESYVRDSWSSNSFHVSATPTPQNSASQ